MPKSAKPIASRSQIVPRLSAERTPIETPMISQMVAAPTISESVLGVRSIISSRTAVRLS